MLSLTTTRFLSLLASSFLLARRTLLCATARMLVIEPWMIPQEWLDMGGQDCGDCSACIRSEFAFVQAHPDTADEIFDKHWSTWFSQKDVNVLVALGLNTVRIPLGYWILEALVDRKTEFYPRGGLQQLRRGLIQLRNAGVDVILDHHALPGVQCTANVQFYTPANYRRALIWTAVMTTLSHIDPAFASVVSIEAVNEPIMDAALTPGYGDFQKQFVQIVRVIERSLGINTGNWKRMHRRKPADSDSPVAALRVAVESDSFPDDHTVLKEALDIHFTGPNPAEAKYGPQVYDNHLYYRSDANEDAYMKSICNLQRVKDDAALGNSPLVFGEWGLPTQFAATEEFLRRWADAQKLAYTKGAGWIFWNFKIEKSALAGDLSRQWSYFDGVKRGYLTVDPSEVHDPHVCDPYIA
ncbi:glycoside hydrolase superfamily [Schizophyllum amplum]|uniref:Glycoside hydrolase superfamily n=1 Tax=Schizophyllum amplum TaxID=97359 RepID=A0A550C1V3_9AGAR|nr:glycoside hydrolase superfamily [Auriculariopsis ampla]